MKFNLDKNRSLIDDKDYKYFKQFKWFTDHKGYVLTTDKKASQKQLHRCIMKCPKNREIDHINGNKSDNRRCNLRISTSSQNKMNMKKRKGTSNYKGVSWKTQNNKWVSQIRFKTKKLHLGYYNLEKDAAIAYNKAAIKFYKEFAILNQI